LQGAPLMHANHGHVFLIEPAPALAYQISSEDTRMLIDIPVDTPGTSAKYSTPNCPVMMMMGQSSFNDFIC
jgi:hypothetical protein